MIRYLMIPVAAELLVLAMLVFASPPVPPAPRVGNPEPADGDWVPQPAGGPAFVWKPGTSAWSDPRFVRSLPHLYIEGSNWDMGPLKRAAFVEAVRWGQPTFQVSRIPSTPRFPIGWTSVGQVFWDGYTPRMRVAGDGIRTVNLSDGTITDHLPELEVRGVIARIGLQLPSD